MKPYIKRGVFLLFGPIFLPVRPPEQLGVTSLGCVFSSTAPQPPCWGVSSTRCFLLLPPAIPSTSSPARLPHSFWSADHSSRAEGQGGGFLRRVGLRFCGLPPALATSCRLTAGSSVAPCAEPCRLPGDRGPFPLLFRTCSSCEGFGSLNSIPCLAGRGLPCHPRCCLLDSVSPAPTPGQSSRALLRDV